MVVIMSLKEAVHYFQQYITNVEFANKLGIHKNHIINYSEGITKSCSDKVADKFYDEFTIDGCKVLLDYWPDEETYIATRKLRS